MGWNWRIANMSATGVLDVNRAGYYEPPNERGYPTVEQARSVIEPIVGAHCAITSQYEPDEWERKLGALGLTPDDFIAKPFNNRGYFLRAQEDATQLYRLLPMWREMGVAESALECWANWAQKAWPLNNYVGLVRGTDG
jgi:hypothetical protein